MIPLIQDNSACHHSPALVITRLGNMDKRAVSLESNQFQTKEPVACEGRHPGLTCQHF